MRLFMRRLILAACLLAAGCSAAPVPERSTEFKNRSDAVRTYHDYLHLESTGVETVHVRDSYFDQIVSLPFYLYLLAREFERAGKYSDAAKLYLRLLIRYSLLEEDNQLGVRVENRLRWVLADKSWIMGSSQELLLRLQQALATQDAAALERIISRDFGFGRDESIRYAVDYHDGLLLIRENLKRSPHVAVDSVIRPENGRIVVRTVGWEGDHRVWYFSLRRLDRPAGWEWTLVAWGENGE
jgi:hypothetical protein